MTNNTFNDGYNEFESGKDLSGNPLHNPGEVRTTDEENTAFVKGASENPGEASKEYSDDAFHTVSSSAEQEAQYIHVDETSPDGRGMNSNPGHGYPIHENTGNSGVAGNYNAGESFPAHSEHENSNGYTFNPGENPPVFVDDKKNGSHKRGRKAAGIISGILCAALLFGCGGYFLGRNTAPASVTQEAEAPTQTANYNIEAQISDNRAEGNFTIPLSTSNTSRQKLSVSEIAEQNQDAVVLITCQIPVTNSSNGFYFNYGGGFFGQQDQYETSLGSGVFITSDGYILTCAHVVDGASAVKVTLSDNTTLDATIVGSDTETDIAVLKVEGNNFSYSTLGDSDALVVGEPCVAIGNPLGTLTGSVTSGVISALERTITVEGQTMNLLQHDAAINSGNSGGPLYNEYGEVIGIVNAKTSGTDIEGINFAIPVNDIKNVIEDLINVGYVTGRPKLGITTYEISAAEAQYYSAPQGVGVVSAESGSGAEAAGLQSGDIITACNDEQTLTVDSLKDIIETCNVGDTVKLTVWRNGNTTTVYVKLMEDTPQETVETSFSGRNNTH